VSGELKTLLEALPEFVNDHTWVKGEPQYDFEQYDAKFSNKEIYYRCSICCAQIWQFDNPVTFRFWTVHKGFVKPVSCSELIIEDIIC